MGIIGLIIFVSFILYSLYDLYSEAKFTKKQKKKFIIYDNLDSFWRVFDIFFNQRTIIKYYILIKVPYKCIGKITDQKKRYT